MSLYQLDWSDDDDEVKPDLAWDWNLAATANALVAHAGPMAVDGASGAATVRVLSRVSARRVRASRAGRERALRRVTERSVARCVVHRCVAARPPPR